MKRNTIAAIRIKQKMEEKSLTGTDLASLTSLPYHTIDNILSGKSNKLDKLEKIAKALEVPIIYLIQEEFSDEKSYNPEFHAKLVKIISDICKVRKFHLTKNKMDKLLDIVYPRINKNDPEELITKQTEAIIDYATKNLI